MHCLQAIAGYRAVIEAAIILPFFHWPNYSGLQGATCKVLVIGAGVAGLVAIGTAQSLGAIVEPLTYVPVAEQIESPVLSSLCLNLRKMAQAKVAMQS